MGHIEMTKAMRKFMAKMGRRGGQATQAGRTKAERSAAGRSAVLARWARVKVEKRTEP